MSRKVTDVGVVIREFIRTGLKNREIAEQVIQHFQDQTFDKNKLIQRIAFTRYNMKKQIATQCNNPQDRPCDEHGSDK